MQYHVPIVLDIVDTVDQGDDGHNHGCTVSKQWSAVIETAERRVENWNKISFILDTLNILKLKKNK